MTGKFSKKLITYVRFVVQYYQNNIIIRRFRNDFSLGAVGVYSYLNKIAFGLKHFAALNRKFDISYVNRRDLIPLTRDIKDLMKGRWLE